MNKIFLGRWNTIIGLDKKRNIYKNILKNCDWANHDHCGGKLCSVPPLPTKQKIHKGYKKKKNSK